MTNLEKASEYLNQAKVWYFLTVDDGQPKGRPFGFHMIKDGKMYLGTGTWKNVYKQLQKDQHVEILAVNGDDFMRIDATAVIENDPAIAQEALDSMPAIKKAYEDNGWTIVMFYLDNAHAEIRGLFEQKEAFDF